jgi:hypothetical protein
MFRTETSALVRPTQPPTHIGLLRNSARRMPGPPTGGPRATARTYPRPGEAGRGGPLIRGPGGRRPDPASVISSICSTRSVNGPEPARTGRKIQTCRCTRQVGLSPHATAWRAWRRTEGRASTARRLCARRPLFMDVHGRPSPPARAGRTRRPGPSARPPAVARHARPCGPDRCAADGPAVRGPCAVRRHGEPIVHRVPPHVQRVFPSRYHNPSTPRAAVVSSMLSLPMVRSVTG